MQVPYDIGYDLITGARFAGAITMLVLSVILVFVNRGKSQLRVYNQARWLIFTGCAMLCVHNFLQFFGHFREQSTSLSWCITVMFLTIVIPSIFLGNIYLLRAGHEMKSLIKRTLLFGVVCAVIFIYGLMSDTLINDDNPFASATFVIAIWLFYEILKMSGVLHHDLKKASTSLTDEELQERHETLRYTAKAMNVVLMFSLFTPWLGLTSTLWLYAILGTIILIVFLWVVVEFCLYGYNMAETIEVNDEIQEAQLIEEDVHDLYVSEDVAKRIEEWVDNKHFTDPSLTIGVALKQMGVSASALNIYLCNNTSATSFRKWLPYLRIEEAKRLMQLHPDHTLQAIAEQSGYANHPNFTRAFKTQEGISPTEWIAKQKRQPNT